LHPNYINSPNNSNSQTIIKNNVIVGQPIRPRSNINPNISNQIIYGRPPQNIIPQNVVYQQQMPIRQAPLNRYPPQQVYGNSVGYAPIYHPMYNVQPVPIVRKHPQQMPNYNFDYEEANFLCDAKI
jgi:hypothetical protein